VSDVREKWKVKSDCIVNSGTAIAKARKDLEDCLSKLSLSSSPHHQHETKTGMHNALHLAENTTCPSCNNVDINATDLRQLLEVSSHLFFIPFSPEKSESKLYIFLLCRCPE
jgi:hypothetical protein